MSYDLAHHECLKSFDMQYSLETSSRLLEMIEEMMNFVTKNVHFANLNRF